MGRWVGGRSLGATVGADPVRGGHDGAVCPFLSSFLCSQGGISVRGGVCRCTR